MVHYLRSRGVVWSLPLAIAVVLLAAHFGHWLDSQPNFDRLARVPAVVFGGLAAAVIIAPGWHRVDDEVEGSVPRPRKEVELILTVSLVVVAAVVATISMPFLPLERGGLELARNLMGLSGLALLAGAVAGSRLAWTLPFCWTAVSYFSVTRVYWQHPEAAIPGWLMYPATYPATWGVALALLATGLIAYRWGGFMPRPRQHPRR